MSEGIKKFVELMKTDEGFQAKLKAAMDNYTGEKTEEAVFESVLLPLAKEYGINSTVEEYKEFMKNPELSDEELAQVAGGANKPWKMKCISTGISLPSDGKL